MCIRDRLKIISFYAKKARGTMVRYLVEHQVQDLEGLLSFNSDGYRYSAADTQDPMQPVFVR
ncbi:MAG: peroxide stress protein YaaA, partial [Flavobacteriia bacterium]|nr:peroxide stress protein YaaA [Flavobacteriia bacterium]